MRQSRVIPLALAFLALVIVPSEASVHYTKIHQNPDISLCTILSQETLRKFKGFKNSHDENELLVKSRPATVPPPQDGPNKITYDSRIIEIFAKNEAVLNMHVTKLCKSVRNLPTLSFSEAPHQSPEIVKIVDSGDQSNRIDVVFMGDGYQAEERQEFFDDIARLTQDMFEGTTFRSYLPVFNIWAIFVPSIDSGIGYSGPINTPFRLYRESGELRAIFPGNSSYARQVCALTGPGGCDYPSLIGNDDYYGGLGGEFVISTRSNRTGTVVLRHEMGHNFADVGEEYDGGGVYSGVNSARTVNGLGWTEWVTSEAREERATYRLLEYLWDDLGMTNVTLNFNSDGSYSRWFMTISVTAAGEEDCLEFLIDGVPLEWTSLGSDDREFYEWYGPQGFTPGSHQLIIRSKTTPTNPQIPRMVASVDLHEFGSEAEFHIDNEHVSAYPTWNYLGSKTFRPTNAGCLMRNMTHNKFCPVCQEGIWSQFLERISLIDSVDVNQETGEVVLNTLKLGQLRAPGNEVEGEQLETRWIWNGTPQPEFDDLFEITAASGSWSVTVKFITSEVRADPQDLLEETENFTIN